MIAGDNSILQRATQAKKLTERGTAKEQIQIEVLGSWGTDGKLDMNKLKTNLEKIGATVTEDGDKLKATLDGYTFTIDTNGNVEKAGPQIEIAEPKVVTNANGTGEDVAANSKTENEDELYISFKPSIAGGTITSVTYNDGTNNNTINPTGDGIYVLKISKNGDYKFMITATADGETITTPYTKNVNKYALRSGIEVGHYVTYIPPKNENAAEKIYSLSNNVSGYNSGTEQTLGQEYKTWRILNKNADGSLDIIPAFYKADLPEGTASFKAINFRDAKGYNNAVTILDDMCDYLYSYENKGITARSLDYDDIEKCMIEGKDDTQGLRKIRKYQKDAVANLTLDTRYSIAKDEKNNTVTYANGRSWYPNIYKTQEGAGINIYSKTGEEVSYGPGVWQKGEEREVEGSVIKAISESDKIALSTDNLKTQANNLTAKCTYYNDTIKDTDFENSTKHNVIFGTGTAYWLASRCVNCDSNYATFRLRYVSSSGLYANILFGSNDRASNNGRRVCPVVHLGSDVQVTKSTQTNDKDHPHTVIPE